MKKNITFPDYENSNLNIISSILKNYGISSEVPIHRELALNELNKKKNIVFMILDGFGYNLFQKYQDTVLPTLKKNFLKPLTAVFPSTTSAVITSLLTNSFPIQHGIIGWTLFFKEYAKYIDFLPNWDSITTEIQDAEKYRTQDLFGLESIFQKLEKETPEIELFNLSPKTIYKSTNVQKVSSHAKIIPHKTIKQFFQCLHKIIKKKDQKKKFIYAYLSDPDKSEHRYGVYSEQVKKLLAEIDQRLQTLIQKYDRKDTMLIITADHGLIDIKKYFYIHEDKELFNCLILPVFPEPRFNSFFVKPHREKNFLKAFQKYEDDFILFTRNEFLAEGWLGKGNPHPKLDDFLGNYLAVAQSDKAFRTVYKQKGKWKNEFKAHHAGITSDEMLVPLFKVEI